MGSIPTLGVSTSSGRGRGRAVELGAASEAETFLALRRAGYRVSVPMMDGGSPYDCIIDDGHQLRRVQIKTGFVNGLRAIEWQTRSTSYHRHGGTSRTYHDTADVFAVWVPETGNLYLVPVAECGSVSAQLRLDPARNGQRRGVRMAADYLVGALGVHARRQQTHEL